MILATKLSVIKNACSKKTLDDLKDVYAKNKLGYTLHKYMNSNEILRLLPYLKNDKKNNDDKINFILLRKIGKTAMPNKYKLSIDELKKNISQFIRY